MKRRVYIAPMSVTVWTLVGAAAALAQVSETRLTGPQSTFPEPFSFVQQVRELPDGRLMLADPLGRALVVIDLEKGTADTLGSVGPGPGEYKQPDAVFALPGDSSLLVDLGNARLTAVALDGSFGETMPMVQGAPGGPGLVIMIPQATDWRGAIYFQQMGGGPRPQPPDSAPVVRYDRSSGALDTLTRVKLPDMTRTTSGGSGNRSVMIRPTPLSPEDAWAVAWDGRVAVARSGDYHVEWVQPDGRVVDGPPVEYELVEIRRADKEEWLENQGNGIRVGISVENGERRLSMGRGGEGGGRDPDDLEWPKVKPAFVADGVWVTPEGDAWVERHVAAGAEKLFDVFGSDGRLKIRVRLPRNRDVVGFGTDGLYVVRTDELGLQWLEVWARSWGVESGR